MYHLFMGANTLSDLDVVPLADVVDVGRDRGVGPDACRSIESAVSKYERFPPELTRARKLCVLSCVLC